MTSPDPTIRLVAAAREARSSAYAPYSGFPVGAAVLDDRGDIHAGANVENAAYPLVSCAERSAVLRAVGEGARRIVAVAIVGAQDRPTWPCGACRQILNEFGPEMRVIVEGPPGTRTERPLADLLPEAFGPNAVSYTHLTLPTKA